MATVVDPKTGVVQESFVPVAKHYGVSVIACPPRRGNRKPCATDCTSLSDGWEDLVPWLRVLDAAGLGPILPRAVEPRTLPCDRRPRNRSGAVLGQPAPRWTCRSERHLVLVAG
jgi:hypothetical protein